MVFTDQTVLHLLFDIPSNAAVVKTLFALEVDVQAAFEVNGLGGNDRAERILEEVLARDENLALPCLLLRLHQTIILVRWGKKKERRQSMIKPTWQNWARR